MLLKRIADLREKECGRLEEHSEFFAVEEETTLSSIFSYLKQPKTFSGDILYLQLTFLELRNE